MQMLGKASDKYEESICKRVHKKQAHSKAVKDKTSMVIELLLPVDTFPDLITVTVGSDRNMEKLMKLKLVAETVCLKEKKNFKIDIPKFTLKCIQDLGYPSMFIKISRRLFPFLFNGSISDMTLKNVSFC
ncbi:hypothetical protein B9Z55_017113 [Caenorhabditis nigoni]|uniref:Uncharacterized protein n=1 Tax=Caenorhabditis nigoni TaxID=1611254 RepID=A0A2G5T7N2_9PELO|nr:hypothetical protein B9Z55_017113 [Caenorhabditis nigoni]